MFSEALQAEDSYKVRWHAQADSSCVTLDSCHSSSIGSNSSGTSSGSTSNRVTSPSQTTCGEVSTVARTRSENDIVPMDVSVLKGQGKGKDGKSKNGKGKDGKEKAKFMDEKDKAEPTSTVTSSGM